MQRSSPLLDAKRDLARALSEQEGFVGVGADNDGIRLYALSDDAPVVRYFRSRYGEKYRGITVSIVHSAGFRATPSTTQT